MFQPCHHIDRLKKASLVSLAICLLVVQGMFYTFGAGMMRAAKQQRADRVEASRSIGICVAPGVAAAPQKKKAHHPQCCVFCHEDRRDAADAALMAVFVTVALFVAPVARGVAFVVNGDIFDSRLSGMFTSWSSRASPQLS
jgi:hypothetical protein